MFHPNERKNLWEKEHMEDFVYFGFRISYDPYSMRWWYTRKIPLERFPIFFIQLAFLSLFHGTFLKQKWTSRKYYVFGFSHQFGVSFDVIPKCLCKMGEIKTHTKLMWQSKNTLFSWCPFLFEGFLIIWWSVIWLILGIKWHSHKSVSHSILNS